MIDRCTRLPAGAVMALAALLVLGAACRGDSARLSSTQTPSPSAAAASPTVGGPHIPDMSLSDVDFVDAQTGWVSGVGAVLATRDGGRTWQPQYSGSSVLQLEFVSRTTGWLVALELEGVERWAGGLKLLGTSDGGATWAPLGEPPEPLVAVDFIDPTLGWGVTTSDANLVPFFDGKLAKTADGGRTWTALTTPMPLQSVCAVSSNEIWAAGRTSVLHSVDGGQTWTTSFTAPLPANRDWSAMVRCAGADVAWVQLVNGGAALSHKPYVIYRTLDRGSHWDVMMAEQYTLSNVITAPEGPGPYPGPFSVVDDKTAFILGFCGPCGAGKTYLRATFDGGLTWQPDAVVSDIASGGPAAVDFVDDKHGWVVLSGAEVVATSNGGKTWSQRFP